MTKEDELTVTELRARLRYDAGTGVFTWAERRGGRIVAGRPAGSPNKDGYIQIGIGGRKYYAHRLAWLYFYGEWPRGMVDHKDTNRANNRISNLRETTHVENGHNSVASKSGKSGIRGVRQLRGKWVASIVHNRKAQHLGCFTSEVDAEAAYKAAKERLFPHLTHEAA